MKKLLLLFVGYFLLNCFAVADEHLTFNNIPIDGSYDEFVGALMDLGLVKLESDSDEIFLLDTVSSGDVLVQVSRPKHGNVCAVASCTPISCDYENLTWKVIYSLYSNSKDFFLKHGAELLKEINDISDLSDDQCLEAIKNDAGRLYSVFGTETGWYAVLIICDNWEEGCYYVRRTLFIDKKNSKVEDVAEFFSYLEQSYEEYKEP